jgi:hypothetical protein
MIMPVPAALPFWYPSEVSISTTAGSTLAAIAAASRPEPEPGFEGLVPGFVGKKGLLGFEGLPGMVVWLLPPGRADDALLDEFELWRWATATPRLAPRLAATSARATAAAMTLP